MLGIELDRVYDVPQRVDDEGRVWYKCLSSMRFATPKVGWAVGSGQILYTDDGGRTWVNQYRDRVKETYINPRRLYAVSPEICWVTALMSATGVRCCYTTNGGKSWLESNLPPNLYPNDVCFLNAKSGWIVGYDKSPISKEGVLLSTADGGFSWKSSSLTKDKLERVSFMDSENGWVIERSLDENSNRFSSKLMNTLDGGRSWHIQNHFDLDVSNLYIFGTDRLFITGENGAIEMSKDRGESWHRLKTGSRVFINALNFSNDKIALAVGDEGTLLYSEDGGLNWTKLKAEGMADHFIDIHFTSESSGILATPASIFSFNLSQS